jgi:hypothetical protein
VLKPRIFALYGPLGFHLWGPPWAWGPLGCSYGTPQGGGSAEGRPALLRRVYDSPRRAPPSRRRAAPPKGHIPSWRVFLRNTRPPAIGWGPLCKGGPRRSQRAAQRGNPPPGDLKRSPAFGAFWVNPSSQRGPGSPKTPSVEGHGHRPSAPSGARNCSKGLAAQRGPGREDREGALRGES